MSENNDVKTGLTVRATLLWICFKVATTENTATKKGFDTATDSFFVLITTDHTKTMENGRVFRTKTGFCRVLPDKIVLTRDGVIGNFAKVTVGNNVSRLLTIYGALSIGLFYYAFDSYKNGRLMQSILFALLGAYLVYGIIISINNSATPIIDRHKIKDIKLKKGAVGLTRSRFEVRFEDEQGKIKKRLIMLPGSLTDGQAETERAIKIMTEEKLMTSRQ